jgi:diguanylate cyclase (GGDEF)-like protein/PAS domain S-box-containing protein
MKRAVTPDLQSTTVGDRPFAAIAWTDADGAAPDPRDLVALLDISEHEILQGMVWASPNALYVVDGRGRVQMWNPAAGRLFGWNAAEIIGHRLPIVDPVDEAEFEALLASVMGGGGFVGVEATRRRKDGSPVDLSISTVPLRNPAGEVVAVFGIAQDLTRVRRAEAALLHQATHDPLTDLLNRRAFLEEVEAEVAMTGTRSMLVCLAIDDFKAVNDMHGHLAGDALLGRFAARLQGAMRPGSVVGRLGGDEFAALLVDVPPRGVHRAVQDLIHSISGQYDVDGRRSTVRVTAGVAPCRHADRPEETLQHADMALFEAKRMARGGFRIFDAAIQRTANERVEVTAAFDRALAEDELEIHFQPVLSVARGVLVGAEALVRWRRADGGWVAPEHFIPMVEQTGAINTLGDWVLEQACSQMRRWTDGSADAAALVVSVNLSPRQLHDPSLVDRVRDVLTRHGIPPGRLQLEVTETALTPDGPAAAAILRRLRRLGVLLAIDDFGTGHSSLTLLRQMPFNVLKVDKSFVQGIGTSADDSAIVAATLGLAQSLGLETTAEGVETPAQLDFLRRHGCDHAQGYLLGRPAPAGARLPEIAAPISWPPLS